MHYLTPIYFLNQPLHVSGIYIVHHQEEFTVNVQQLVCLKVGTHCNVTVCTDRYGTG
jgi:hypothetical protein